MIVLGRYRCSICDRPKRDANHWFMGAFTEPWGFCIRTWNDDEARTRTLHYCSEQCSHIAMSRYCSERDAAKQMREALNTLGGSK